MQVTSAEISTARPGRVTLKLSASASARLHAQRRVVVGDWLRATYPAAFPPSPVPLKIRVIDDICERLPADIARGSVADFLAHYTRTPEYLRALAADGAVRVRLDGSHRQRVSAAQRALAARMLAELTGTGAQS